LFMFQKVAPPVGEFMLKKNIVGFYSKIFRFQE
jgi:hypothetical protein